MQDINEINLLCFDELKCHRFSMKFNQQLKNYKINLQMTESQQNNFFATGINQTGNEEGEQEKKPDILIEQNKQEIGEAPAKQTQNNDQKSLKRLLQTFNAYDKDQKGTIPIQQCQNILSSHKNLPNQSIQNNETYYKLSLPSNQNHITFDQFLFIFGLCQFNVQNRSVDEQYQYCLVVDFRIVDFMRLLNSYRKKCQKEMVYQEARKSKNKIEEIREKQYERRKNYLNVIHRRELEGLQQRQKEKFIQFCQIWDEFMNQYENTAAELIKKLSYRHQQQLKEFMQKNKQQLASKVRFSKQVVELQDLQKKLVKAQQYQKADKVRMDIQQLKITQLQKKQKQDNAKVQLRAQTLRKQHVTAMNTLLQKIQKDRNDQSRQRMADSQKIIVKNKTLKTQVKHRVNETLKKIYEGLHNVSIEDNRITTPSQLIQRTRNQNIRQVI